MLAIWYNMANIYPDLSSISSPFEGILLDAYGVFWQGNALGLFPHAASKMKALVDAGKVVGILSNSTQPASKEIAKVEKKGLILGEHFHFFLTSGEVAKTLFSNGDLPFSSPRKQFYLFGETPHPHSPHESIFQEGGYLAVSDITQADFIYISIPHVEGKDVQDPEPFYQEIEKAISSQLPVVCANPDPFAMEGNPAKAVIRAGLIAELYEKMGGKRVFYIGKPHPFVYETALQLFQQHRAISKSQILMVGDTPETDIRGANGIQMASALVTHTGIMKNRSLHTDLSALLSSLLPQDVPNYFIERM